MANHDDEQRPRGINNLQIRDEVSDDVPSDLPEQMGGVGLPPLFPGTHIFRIPSTIAQLVETYDEVVKDAQGNAVADPANPQQALLVQRIRVRFDKDDPLIEVATSRGTARGRVNPAMSETSTQGSPFLERFRGWLKGE